MSRITSYLALRGIPSLHSFLHYSFPLPHSFNAFSITSSSRLCTKYPILTTSTSSFSTQKGQDKNPQSSSKTDEDDLPNNEHFRLKKSSHPLGPKFDISSKVPQNYWDNPVPNQIYSPDELAKVQQTHVDPHAMYERVALFAVKLMRTGFDIVSRYKGPGGEMTRRAWLNRCLFLETVAGVPGMVAGMARHLKSLRTMKRDHGWIHTLLSEAENERMHLLIFMKMKDPGIFFRFMVIMGQGVFFNAFFFTYLISPRTCHRFVGYLEEEAVKTYTGLLKDIDQNGHLKEWGNELAHPIAIRYYKLKEDALVRDVIGCIRADEANHRDVNHTFAALDPDLDRNPFLDKHGKKP